MAIEKAELDRVRAIHKALDRAAAESPGRGLRIKLTITGGELFYTATEVRAWPETKAKLTQCAHGALAGDGAAWVGGRHPQLFTLRYFAEGYDLSCKPSVDRGLCIYKEMLSDAFPTGRHVGPVEDGIPVGRVNGAQAEALVFSGIDPGSDAEPEFKVECHRFNDAHARKLTDALPANVAARARNIAALAAELRKPVTPRFPHEARSDRVTGYRRWGNK